MIEPIRLRDGGGTEIERLLLDAGARTKPSFVAKCRAAAVVLFALAPRPSPRSLGSSAFPSAAFATWLLIGVGASAAALGAIHHMRAVHVVGPVPEAAHAEPMRAAPERAQMPATANERPPVAFATSQETAVAHAPGAIRLALRPIGNEIEVIDAAREAVVAGDSRRALASLDGYDRKFPRGTFQQEALLLRIEALVRTGDHAGAAALAQRFMRLYPGSAHAKRLQSLVAAKG